jgi:hypothetical protein
VGPVGWQIPQTRGRHRGTDQIALHHVTPKCPQKIKLNLVFNTFCHHFQAQAMRHGHNGFHHLLARDTVGWVDMLVLTGVAFGIRMNKTADRETMTKIRTLWQSLAAIAVAIFTAIARRVYPPNG